MFLNSMVLLIYAVVLLGKLRFNLVPRVLSYSAPGGRKGEEDLASEFGTAHLTSFVINS